MAGEVRGEGVQVVFAEEGRYRVDEAALRGVAQRARGLPVAVVSVAGATRGGKSFLLDFFLRYLRAPEAARRSGSWLGADDEPLTGFSWRGGWQRNTTGILLWSEPIIVKQEVDGREKKIAVLLMDTQGTFDDKSTYQDCTAIFAISTLISSLQIYNLSQIIREDDLQHLQLFVEYGRHARTEDGGKPFQALMFRVRDWMCPYEHPYGAQGGERYLQNVLATEFKRQELVDLREHIRSCFDSISCFLTPHPGLAVADINFNGRLCDLSPDFKDSLLEFVPLILEPSKLIPKIINGNEVTAGELPAYFQGYVEVFNSEETPTAQTMLQATITANLSTAVSTARETYCASMERVSEAATRVVKSAVPQLHAAALQEARAAFAARRTLAAPPVLAARLDELLEELNGQLAHHIAVNDAKILRATRDAKAVYEVKLNSVKQNRPLCLHPLDVAVVHGDAKAAMMAAFDGNRQPPQDGVDPERSEMLQWLEYRLRELKEANDANNRAALAQASAVYATRAGRAARAGALGPERLRAEHGAARAEALSAFNATRNRTSAHPTTEDNYINELASNIEEQFAHWESSNKKNDKASRRWAVSEYNSRMAAAMSGHACLHPRALRREHGEALRAARADLRAERPDDDGGADDELTRILESRYEELKESNDASNDTLVADAYREYTRIMDVKCAPSLTSLLIVPWVIKILVQLPKYHENARKDAIEYFLSRRRGSSDDDDDEYYLNKLKEKVEAAHDDYRNPILALARELNIPLTS